MGKEDDQAANNVQERHQRHDLFRKPGDSADTAQENEAGDYSHADPYCKRTYVKRILKGISDRIGLYHISHKAKGQDQGNGEKSCQKTAETSFKRRLDIIDRTSGKSSVFNHSGMLRHNGFRIDCSHAEESAYPHPENSSRASCGDGCGRSGNVSGSHLSGDGCCQCLERAESVFAAFAMERKVSEQGFHSGAEFPDLNKAEHKSKEYAASKKKDQQSVIPEKCVEFHNSPPKK